MPASFVDYHECGFGISVSVEASRVLSAAIGRSAEERGYQQQFGCLRVEDFVI